MAAVTSPGSKPNPLGTTLVVALVLVLAYQLAYWTWQVFSPSSRSAPPSAQADVDMAAIARLFGASAPGEPAATASAGSLRLKGVVAPTPGVQASAIFSTGAGKDLSVYIGNEVQPGTKL